MWETVSTFVLHFSQDGYWALLAFLIETKDAAALQLAEHLAHNKVIEHIKLQADFVYYLIYTSAFVTYFDLNIRIRKL